MGLKRILLVAAGAAALIGLQLRAPAFAADETVSPCCAKVCNPTTGTSIACKPAALGGLGANDAAGNVGLVRGCVDVETAPPGSICYGGAIADTGAPALVNGCLCLFGDAGSVSPGSGTCLRLELGTNLLQMLTPEECTLLAVQQCGQNVITTPNDPACGTCPAPPTCGDHTCDGTIGENCATCAADCACTGGNTCQNGTCAPPPPTCGDNTCDPSIGENCATCAADCGCSGGNTCQNGSCAPPPPTCGDNACDPSIGENCATCAADCACTGGDTCQNGTCAPPCGDGICDPNAGENCSTCAVDCGCTGTDTCENGVCTPAQCIPEGATCLPEAHGKDACCADLQCTGPGTAPKTCRHGN